MTDNVIFYTINGFEHFSISLMVRSWKCNHQKSMFQIDPNFRECWAIQEKWSIFNWTSFRRMFSYTLLFSSILSLSLSFSPLSLLFKLIKLEFVANSASSWACRPALKCFTIYPVNVQPFVRWFVEVRVGIENIGRSRFGCGQNVVDFKCVFIENYL